MGTLGRIAALPLGIALALAAGQSAAQDTAPPAEGWQLRPGISWTGGDHRADVSADTRWRWENWKARTPDDSNMVGGRSRLRLRWSWRETLAAAAEGQHVFLDGLTDNSTGAAATYRAYTAGGNRTDASAFHLRQLWIEARPLERAWLRVGRQPIGAGTLITYSEPTWTYLRQNRLAQRLVGTVGWSHVERSYDGVAGVLEARDVHLHAFTAQPTTGVYDARRGYQANWNVLVGGAELTARRGRLLENTDLSTFFVAYSDARDPSEVTGLFGDLRVYTLGASALGVYPLGPGAADLLVWAAGQFGDYEDETPSGVRGLDQCAWAAIGEVGYRLAAWPGKPWLRTGVNAASGDAASDDGTHGTFFNVLPTNHLYYGYADQLAFQNLVNWFAQLRLAPRPGVDIELFVHRLWLADSADGRYSGTGAFARDNFGITRSPSNGSNDVGTELDTVVTWQATPHVSVMAGFAYLFGGEVFADSPSRDTRWGFVQMSLRY